MLLSSALFLPAVLANFVIESVNILENKTHYIQNKAIFDTLGVTRGWQYIELWFIRAVNAKHIYDTLSS